MNTYILESDGLPALNATYPALNIVWHKTPKETYCHSAQLMFNAPSGQSLATITLNYRQIFKPGKKISKSIESSVTRHLPCKSVDDCIIVPLDDTKLIDIIEMCEYTHGKKKKQLVRYPTGLSFSYAGEEKTFHFLDKFPLLLMCEPLLDQVEINDKITIHINLADERFGL